MFRRYRGPLILFLCSALGGLFPLLITLSAGAVVDMNDCVLHEGYPNPCVIFGADRGELLYGLGVFGWFSLLTLPIGALGGLVAVLWAVVRAVGVRWERENA